MRRAAKRDHNEKAIVEALEAAGWHVHRCSDEGLPDLYVTKSGRVPPFWIEVKTPGGTLRLAQRTLWEQWALSSIAVHVVESPTEAIQVVAGCQTVRHWRDYPVKQEGRGAKRSRSKSWIPVRLRTRPGT